MKQIERDVIIIGAGLSGIGAACHLERKNKNTSYVILESRKQLGGTWSLFQYPGIRSDSDMYTFGYSFKEWKNPKSFADAPSILEYLNEAADEYDVKKHICYEQRALSYDFNSIEQKWFVKAINPTTKEETIYVGQFILNCSGYYNYDSGYSPEFKGSDNFKGQLIHPQKWPSDLDLKNKKVVVIGSGATAITIVPKIAKEVELVTMLQRSPTYVSALPNKDKIAAKLKRWFPSKLAHSLIRGKNILFSIIFYWFCKTYPDRVKKYIVKQAARKLGDVPVDPHFEPHYNPWDQRFCIAPNGDLFRVLRKGEAEIVTDHIEKFTETGIQLTSGKHLEADIIVTATGLRLLAFGGVQISIDGTPFNLSEQFVYKGMMVSELPNLLTFVGYTNASWTLKSDLTSEYFSRLLNYMEAKKYKVVKPKVIEDKLYPLPLIDLDAGYIRRAKKDMPSQGHKAPWRVYQNYIRDYKMLRIDSLQDKRLHFS